MRGGARPNSGRKKLFDEQSACKTATEMAPAAWASLLKAAEGGNVKAAEIILAYAYGKPNQTVDLGGGIKILIERVNAGSQAKATE